MMKSLLMICLVLGMTCADAGHRIHRRSVPRPQPFSLTWKQIAAGGAAAGTVVAAYKISNGIENGLEKAAEKGPGRFLNIWASLPLLLMLAGIFVLYKWIHPTKTERETK